MPFKIGKALLLGKGTDVTIFATGHLVWTSVEAAQELAGAHELARGLRAVGGHVDGDLPRGVGGRIEEPDLRAALVHDALAVGLREARVKIVVIRVAGEAGAVAGDAREAVGDEAPRGEGRVAREVAVEAEVTESEAPFPLGEQERHASRARLRSRRLYRPDAAGGLKNATSGSFRVGTTRTLSR